MEQREFMMLQGIIFDLDGCLIDSGEVQKKAYFGSYEIVVGDQMCPPYEEYIKYTGDSIDNIFHKMGFPKEMSRVYKEINRSLVSEVVVNEEAMQLIRDLRKRKIKIAICTGKNRDRTLELLKYYQIENLFDVLVCCDDVELPKPSGEPMIKAMQEMKLKRDEVIVVGDGYNDILSAKNAGMKSVLTTWYGDAGVQRESDYVVESVNALRNIILGKINYR